MLQRREFLKGSALLAAATQAARLIPSTESAGEPGNHGRSPNDRLNVAVIGVKSRGRDHVNGFANRHNCAVTHICDADRGVVGAAMTAARNAQGFEPAYVQDMRAIFDNPAIDLVSIATPNHWHSLAAIWALQAGKHVYVEKPVSHNVWEGRRLVQIARQTGKLCQAGTQIRSNPGIRQAIEYLRRGELGAVRVARGLCYKLRPTIGRTNRPQAAPATCNYDLWCGPASNAPLRRTRLHYDWHWVWEYGNGDLGNQGIHQMDVARWGLGKTRLANSVISLGGRFGYTDDGQTPNTQLSHFDYGDCHLIFEVRGLPTAVYRGAAIGNVFHCANGYLVMPRYDVAIAYRPDGTEIRRWTESGDHFGNFVRAVRSNRRQDLHGEIEEGHLSSALCHLANISYQLGQNVGWQNHNGALGNQADATDSLNRMREHLAANNLNVQQLQLRLGPRLTLDPQAERFINHDRANGLLSRRYRAPYVVPGAAS